MSHATNGRDGNPKYLGVKKYHNEIVRPGEIIVCQRGTKFYPGRNTYLAKNFSIHSKILGKVIFKHINKSKQLVDVLPVESPTN